MKNFVLFLGLFFLLFGCTQVPQDTALGLDGTLPSGTPASDGIDEEIWAKGSLKVETKTVNYFTGTQGFLAKPADKGTYPGIIMIHEWWGLNDNIK